MITQTCRTGLQPRCLTPEKLAWINFNFSRLVIGGHQKTSRHKVRTHIFEMRNASLCQHGWHLLSAFFFFNNPNKLQSPCQLSENREIDSLRPPKPLTPSVPLRVKFRSPPAVPLLFYFGKLSYSQRVISCSCLTIASNNRNIILSEISLNSRSRFYHSGVWLQKWIGPWGAAGPARPAFQLIGADEAQSVRCRNGIVKRRLVTQSKI